MHTRKRGKARSRKPRAPGSYAWVRADKDEILKIIERLTKEGKTPADIGRVLRDEYGVPSVQALFGKKMEGVLSEKNIAPKYPSDLMALIRRAVNVQDHIKKFPRDRGNKIKQVNIESKIKRLARYYRGGKLPADWKYDREEAALLVK